MKTTKEYEEFAIKHWESYVPWLPYNESQYGVSLLKAWDEHQAQVTTQPKPEELIPFDLEEALKEPNRVRTRTGDKVLWSYFKVDKEFPIVYFTDALDAFMSVATNGIAVGNRENDYDLMLVKKKETVWFGLYEDVVGFMHTTPIKNTKEQVEECIDNGRKLLKFYSYEE